MQVQVLGAATLCKNTKEEDYLQILHSPLQIDLLDTSIQNPRPNSHSIHQRAPKKFFQSNLLISVLFGYQNCILA